MLGAGGIDDPDQFDRLDNWIGNFGSDMIETARQNVEDVMGEAS